MVGIVVGWLPFAVLITNRVHDHQIRRRAKLVDLICTKKKTQRKFSLLPVTFFIRVHCYFSTIVIVISVHRLTNFSPIIFINYLDYFLVGIDIEWKNLHFFVFKSLNLRKLVSVLKFQAFI